MDVKTLKRTLMNEARVPDSKRKSLLIEAIHGVGKSEIIAQVAAELSKTLGNFIFRDIRLGQRDTGDIIGMPRVLTNKVIKVPTFVNGAFQYREETISEVMGHDVPVWFPRDPASIGFLLFDEMHNATKETLQAVQEITLDRKLNGEPLPPGFTVIGAGNHIQDIYGTTTLNPAQYDRFMTIRFKPTVKEWMDYAELIEVHPAVTRFISLFEDLLDPPEKMEQGSEGEGATRYPSRRSWVALSNRIVEYAALGDDMMKDVDYLFHISMTLVGRIVASQFQDFVKKDYKAISAVDILDKMTQETEAYLKTIKVPEVAWYRNLICKHVNKEKITKLEKKQSDNLQKFFFAIPKEGAMGFFNGFMTQCKLPCADWFATNRTVKDFANSLVSQKESTK